MKLKIEINIVEICGAAILLAALILFPVKNVTASQSSQLVMGVHPYLPTPDLEERFSPILKYLSSQIGIPMSLSISKDYEVHIENVGNKIFDIAYMGPSSYVDLSKKYGEHTLLSRLEINGKPYFNGYIVVKHDSQINNLQDLKGKKFAFGSPHSTMSYLVPRYMLNEAGVSLDSLGEYKFQGNHKNVALSILLGEFDAGAIKEETYFKYKEKGLRSIATSPSISEHIFVSRRGLPVQIENKIKNAMYALSVTEEGRNILKSIKKGVSGLVPANDTDYDILRVIMR